MEKFLNHPEATFYHITTIEKWDKIKQSGLKSRQGKIFVSRVGEFPILISIAIQQIPEIYTTNGIVVIKIPQAKNKFLPNEISPDNQALVEWTRPFQSIILKDILSADKIELMMIMPFKNETLREFILNYFTQIAESAQYNYAFHSIMEQAKNIDYFSC